MSDNKRNRKNNQNKVSKRDFFIIYFEINLIQPIAVDFPQQEPKRPIILAKKIDKDDKIVSGKPRILLKSKDTSEPSRITSNVTQISIASRPIEPSTSNVDATKTNRSQASLVATASKESHTTSGTVENATESTMQSMKKPCVIVSDHYQMQNYAQDFLIETNTDFVVVGVIGTQAAGKSFILNMLIDDDIHSDADGQVSKLLSGRTGIFQMRNQMKESLSNMCCTEGIQMYITRHRIILLDCSPVLCNPYKKEAILNEIDDLKMIIFLLSVCNTLIVVEDCGFNMHLLRLLLTAESMKIDVQDLDEGERRHSPNILIFKNKCQNHDFMPEAKQITSDLYRAYFQFNGLNGTQTATDQESTSITRAKDDLDIFFFPWIDENCEDFLNSFFFKFFFFFIDLIY